MANEHLKRMKDLAGIMEKSSPSTPQNVSRNPQNIVSSVKAADRAIEHITEQFMSPAQESKDTYSSEHDIELLSKIRNGEVSGNFEGRNIPRAILESIRNNPLIPDPSLATIDDSPRMRALTEKLANPAGVSRMKEIQRTLDSSDKMEQELSSITEDKVVGTGIDYIKIKSILEQIIDEKFSQLNESITHSSIGSNVKSMTIKDNRFLFLAENGDIYECKMTYIGKNKRKS